MTLTIELPPELERRLREQAEREGLDAGSYLERLVDYHLATNGTQPASLWDSLSPEEWRRQTREWAASHDQSIPPLPDEAVSRESFYEERIDAILGGHERSPKMDPSTGTTLPNCDRSGLIIAEPWDRGIRDAAEPDRVLERIHPPPRPKRIRVDACRGIV